MKNVVFERLKLKNILSFGNEPVELVYEKGITFVTGFNYDKNSKNGVGKTTLLIEGLSYVLFGETYRGIPKAKIINFHTNDIALGEVEFTVNEDRYKIVRGLKPSKLFLYKNGVDISKGVIETGKDILDILGVSKEIFVNILVMSNQNNVPFLKKKKADKVSFIEGIIGMETFSDMYEEANDALKDHNKKLTALGIKLDESKRTLQNDLTFLANEDTKIKNNIIRLENELTSLKSILPKDNSIHIQEIENQIAQIEAIIQDKESKINAVKVKRAQIETDIRISRNELRKLDEKKANSICPTCKRPLESHTEIDLEGEKGQIKAHIKRQEETISKIDAKLKSASKEHEDNKDKKRSWISEKSTLIDEQKQFERAQNSISNKEIELQRAKETVNPFIAKKELSEGHVRENTTLFEDKNKRTPILETVKHVFSPVGVKAVVIKKIIDVLNERFNHYLQRLKTPCRCEFNEFFEETFYTPDTNVEILYDNFSGGEAGRINFALMFAFRDIRKFQSNISINLSIFDEIFDSALDQYAVEDIMDILRENPDDCYYIITHRADVDVVTNCKMINLEKRKGITTMEKS